MTGAELLEAFAKQARSRRDIDSLPDAELARELGISVAMLHAYRKKELTPTQAATLIEKHGRAAERRLTASAIIPIVEFFELDATWTVQGKTCNIFSPRNEETGKENRYLAALRKRLTQAHGIYIFHDSRGRAIYAGKAVEQNLWKEMNNAFNRDRGEVQNIKRAYHPVTRGTFGGGLVKIKKQSVALHHIASYASAYEVPDGLIGKFEALIVRSFANDLLNVRMETI
ncbi:hypothetical protein NX02_28800 [Sphingomonas sanxanigenens DSM 19645 = NX02]|uniref:Uncharacterized protein n=2 Tax=Sphingomonas sanxanigenens TaxID=397260 RepID=W0ANM5_9SPHN|nr:hypothetical protein NX02_28800 [Sphingomonas sanxanigenens DSM 19645 = NX02]